MEIKMNYISILSYFCEIHGPSLMMATMISKCKCKMHSHLFQEIKSMSMRKREELLMYGTTITVCYCQCWNLF